MKKIILSILPASMLLACGGIQNSPTANQYMLMAKENIQNLLDSFVYENACDACVYELYINQISPDSSNLILYAGEMSLAQKESEHFNQKPVGYTLSLGTKVSIYSGVERYFTNALSKAPADLKKEVEGSYTMWLIVDDAGELKIYSKKSYGYPFIPFPQKHFETLISPPIVRPE